MERIQNLADAVTNLRAEGEAIRQELRRRTTVLAWLFAAGAVILACALLAAYTVSLNNQAAIEKSNRQWCPLVGLLIPRPGEARATTPRGQDLEANARALYASFGCGTAR
jgi:hypothetical protein